MPRVRTTLAATAMAPAVLATAWLDVLLLAASRGGPRVRGRSPRPGELVVVVPAHDEEHGLPTTLASLRQAAGESPLEVLVVADNCSDATAEVATAAGATVLVRDDPTRPGKGMAVAHGLSHLRGRPRRPERILVVDADCTLDPDAVRVLSAALDRVPAVQLRYVVANPEASRYAALRFAAFAVSNHVRPAGRTALGMSSGLLGTGMAFRAPLVLDQVPMDASGLAEDLEYTLELLNHDVRVHFLPRTRVSSPMPVDPADGESQAHRWEQGRITARRRWAGPLLHAAGRRPLRRLEVLELLGPPLSALGAATVAGGAVALTTRTSLGRRALATTAVGQGAFVLGSLALARAPRSVYAALAAVPVHAARRLRVVATTAEPDGPWVRTARASDPPERRPAMLAADPRERRATPETPGVGRDADYPIHARRRVVPARVRLGEALFDPVTEQQVVEHVLAEVRRGVGGRISTANVHHLGLTRSSATCRRLLAEADLVVADGTPLVWASRVQGQPLPQRVAGSDLIWAIARGLAATDSGPLYLAGGNPGTAEAAATMLEEHAPGLQIAGTCCPAMGFEDRPEEIQAVIDAIVTARPAVVLVGLGFPKQDLLIERLRPRLPGAWFVGVGISFSFVAGEVRRASGLTGRLGLEWLHRLAQEPRRLGRRYLVDQPPTAARMFAAAALARTRRELAGRDPGGAQTAVPAEVGVAELVPPRTLRSVPQASESISRATSPSTER